MSKEKVCVSGEVQYALEAALNLRSSGAAPESEWEFEELSGFRTRYWVHCDRITAGFIRGFQAGWWDRTNYKSVGN